MDAPPVPDRVQAAGPAAVAAWEGLWADPMADRWTTATLVDTVADLAVAIATRDALEAQPLAVRSRADGDRLARLVTRIQRARSALLLTPGAQARAGLKAARPPAPPPGDEHAVQVTRRDGSTAWVVPWWAGRFTPDEMAAKRADLERRLAQAT